MIDIDNKRYNIDFIKSLLNEDINLVEISDNTFQSLYRFKEFVKSYTLYNPNVKSPSFIEDENVKYFRIKPSKGEVVKNDLLFINSYVVMDYILANKLHTYKDSTNAILLNGSVKWGNRNEIGGGGGVLKAVDIFTSRNPKWTISDRNEFGDGLILLTKVKDEEKPKRKRKEKTTED